MTTPGNKHAQGNFAMHTDFPFLGHPSAGAWISYGLGSASENLPSFVALEGSHAVPPHGGVGLYSSGFLPAQHQASILQVNGAGAVTNIKPSQAIDLHPSRLNFVNQIDRGFNMVVKGHDNLEAAIQHYETAYRRQSSIPEICDISGESETTRKLYGLDDEDSEKVA